MRFGRVADRALLSGVLWINAKAKALSIRLTKWTGKSSEYIHPKHLLSETEAQHWYLAHLNRGDRVLDVGCGNAGHTLRAAKRCASVTGVDQSEVSLAVGYRRSLERGILVSLVRADVEAGLPFLSSLFDRVLCLDLLEHVNQRERLLGEIQRVLRPHGLLLLAVPNRDTSWRRRLVRAEVCAYSDPDHKIEYTLSELQAELGRNGFSIRQLYPSVYDLPLVGLLDVAGGLSLTLYRWGSQLRRRLAAKYPEENAGFYAVCAVR